jgi:hypothetical protein
LHTARKARPDKALRILLLFLATQKNQLNQTLKYSIKHNGGLNNTCHQPVHKVQSASIWIKV